MGYKKREPGLTFKPLVKSDTTRKFAQDNRENILDISSKSFMQSAPGVPFRAELQKMYYRSSFSSRIRSLSMVEYIPGINEAVRVGAESILEMNDVFKKVIMKMLF